MSDLRTAAQQALDSINELFAAEQSEGGERGGHIRTPATREHLVRVAQARKALHESCDTLRAALAQQAEPVEPVAWECKAGGLKPLTQRQYDAQTAATKRHYTRIAPPQRKPLTEEEISAIDWKAGETLHDFARAIERAHGIGGEA